MVFSVLGLDIGCLVDGFMYLVVSGVVVDVDDVVVDIFICGIGDF